MRRVSRRARRGPARHRVAGHNEARESTPGKLPARLSPQFPASSYPPRYPQMDASQDFFDLYTHGFARVAVAVPAIRVADPAWNAARTVELMQEAVGRGAALVAFPELGLSGYTCDDLFHQHALLDACEAALGQVVAASATVPITAV